MNQELFKNARWLTGAIARGLQGRGGEGVAGVLDRLSAQALDQAHFRERRPARLPV